MELAESSLEEEIIQRWKQAHFFTESELRLLFYQIINVLKRLE